MKGLGVILFLASFAIALSIGVQGVFAIDIDNCSVLDTPGETYVLTQDVTDSPYSTCMNITADNIVLDCNGNDIDGVSAGNSRGINASGRNNVTVTNCNISNWAYGVYLNLTRDSRVSDSNFSGNTDSIILYNSRENNLSHNAISGGNDAVYLSNSSYNNIFYNNISGSDLGVSFYESSSYNVLSDNFIYSTNSQGFYIYQSYYNSFRDSLINSTSTNIYHFSSCDTEFLNVTMDESKISVDAGQVFVKWYADFTVLSKSDGSPVNQANVTAFNANGLTEFSALTNSSGQTGRLNMTQSLHNFTGQFSYNNYSVETGKTGYIQNTTTMELTGNVFMTINLEYVPPPDVEVKTYDLGLSEKNLFKTGKTVRIRAFVNHTLGRGYLENSTVLITDNVGGAKVSDELMTNVSQMSNGYVYEYNYTIPADSGGRWEINVTSTDSSDFKGYDSTTITLSEVSIQVKLVLNSTDDRIYIPSSGAGETTFSGLPSSEYTSPHHYYLASYSDGLLKSLVFSYRNAFSVFTEKYSNAYALGTDLSLAGSAIFLALSKGDWRAVNNRIDSIEEGGFLSAPEPSFSYGLGTGQPLKIVLDYDSIDLNRTLKVGRGTNRLIIEKKGLKGGKISVDVRTS